MDLAIECYDKALELGDREQEGVLLVMRGTALLQRAYACRCFNLRYFEIITCCCIMQRNLFLLKFLCCMNYVVIKGDFFYCNSLP